MESRNFSSNRYHDIDISPETALRLQIAEQGVSTLSFPHPHTPSSRTDSIRTEGSRRTRSEATKFSCSPPLRHARGLIETQLGQESYLRTD
jgi:hypothetical protein